MKTTKLLIIAGVFTVSCAAIAVNAKTVTFVDSSSDNSHWNFPGYTWTNGGIEDEVGTPKVTDMVITWDEVTGFLQSVVLHLHTSSTVQDFDSLFINSNYNAQGSDQYNSDWDSWDYFVHSGDDGNGTIPQINETSGLVPHNGLYSVADPYVYTTNSSGGRTDHPNGIDDTSLTFVTDFTRQHAPDSMEIVYDFTTLSLGDKIILGEDFAFAYSPWCANDLVWGTHNGDPVPEPATLLLFGAGLVGLAGLRKKQKA